MAKKKYSNLFIKGTLLGFLALVLAGCGQPGDLYIPETYSVDKPPPTSGKRPRNQNETHETSKQILEKKDD